MTTKKTTTTGTGSVDLVEQELQDIELQRVQGGHTRYKMSDITISTIRRSGPKPGRSDSASL